MDNANVQTGIELFKSGNKPRALQIFLDVLKREPENEIAWLWLAACVESPQQKRDCFHKILAINPNNTYAQKALAELELQSISEPKPVPQSGTVLKCPSCGSVMGQPDHTGLVQCRYCGTTITYHPPVEKTERKSVERYLEICKSALEVKNYKETLEYANKVLEIDPENVDAWVNKAIASFWFTTEVKNRYDEAMNYLQKAEAISSNNERIREVRQELTYQQAQWQIYLGNEKIKQGDDESHLISTRYSDGLIQLAGRQLEAYNKKMEYYLEAMNLFLTADSYTPNDVSVLENIEALASSSKSFNWGNAIYEKIKILQLLRSKPIAEEKLPKLKQELQQVQENLAALNKRNSLFDAFKLDAAEDKEKKLKEEIARCEAIIAYKL
ncbi:MAG: hypothetical protein JNJ96_06570 [Anaerolineales bacterium]|nr:hypothetical protein [Anaerolineales bacterium]HNQ94675.1 hypothetical protein [Anaerolineales bacterium]